MAKTDAKSLINRGNNLLVTGFLALIGLGVSGEVFTENEFVDKIDDIILVILGIWSIIWYFTKDNKYKRSALPLGLVITATVTKIIWLFVEFDDKDTVGDEFGLVLPLAAMVIISILLYTASKKYKSK